ncbi:AAA family ATPase, partial [Nostoc sp. UCD121]|uniref:AAA family ATPase n=1 Tax=Nostoc sp. UCD121 TaxID=2681305 RepID=UPI001C89E134
MSTPPNLSSQQVSAFPQHETITGVVERLEKAVGTDIERVRDWIERFTASRKIQLSEQQRQAVETAAYSKIMILTGGPGVGKTFTTHTIVSLWKAMGKSIALAAPTGRAAQRLG